MTLTDKACRKNGETCKGEVQRRKKKQRKKIGSTFDFRHPSGSLPEEVTLPHTSSLLAGRTARSRASQVVRPEREDEEENG